MTELRILSPSDRLLLAIARCPVEDACLQDGARGPCSRIVLSQGVRQRENLQVPEPWSGHLASAPILFLSSNPSISAGEDYPTAAASDGQLVSFFNDRLDGHFIRHGIYARKTDGT